MFCKGPALGNLAHESGSLRTSGFFEAGIFIDIDQDGSRPTIFVTMTSSRSCTPATNSGKRVLTSDNDKVLP